MLRTLLERLTGDPGSDGDDAGDDGSADAESTFRPSRLDASVLFAHGADVELVDDDADDLQAEARRLDREHRRE